MRLASATLEAFHMTSFSLGRSTYVYKESSLTQCENSCSYEAGLLEQPELEPPADMWTMTVGKFFESRIRVITGS